MNASKLKEDNTFTVTCICGKNKTFVLSKRKTTVRVRCTCGKTSEVTLCGRKTYRKVCMIEARLNNTVLVTILDISENGYKIRSNRKLLLGGNSISFRYILPDKQQTIIEEMVILVRKDGNEYGLKAIEKPYSKSQRAKGFWLRP